MNLVGDIFFRGGGGNGTIRKKIKTKSRVTYLPIVSFIILLKSKILSIEYETRE